jgi:hypothetical protein
MTVWFKRFALLPQALIAVTLVACGEATSSGDVSTTVPVSELIEGEWSVTKYEFTYDIAPDNPIDIADSSEIDATIGDGKYSIVCFPACLGVIKKESGTYTVDEARRSIRFTVTQSEVTPEGERLPSPSTGEWRATYRFPSRNRVHLDARVQTLYQGTFVQADVIIEAERD